MEKQVSLYEAWDDFFEYAKEEFKRVPNEIYVAENDRRGRRITPAGTVVTLGHKRAARLFEKYRPGHYTLVVPEPYFITKISIR